MVFRFSQAEGVIPYFHVLHPRQRAGQPSAVQIRSRRICDSQTKVCLLTPLRGLGGAVPAGPAAGALLYVGTEPNLRWRAFSSIMLHVALRCGVETIVCLGALNDAVPSNITER